MLKPHLPPADKPNEDPEAVGDPYKTLFIARLVRVSAIGLEGLLTDCRVCRTKMRQTLIFDVRSRHTVSWNAYVSLETRKVGVAGTRSSSTTGSGT